jgi:putative ABC transport system permease protein
VLAVMLAIVLALAAGEWLMPAVNAFLRTGARLNDPLLPLMLAGVLASGLAAGIWPAFVLSAFRPARTLRGWSAGDGAGAIRGLLVALQFSMLIMLAIAATVIWQQRNYATHEAVKANIDKVLLVQADLAPVPGRPLYMLNMQSPQACPAAFRDAVRRLPGVRDVRCTSQSFLRANSSLNWFARDGQLRGLYSSRVDPGIFRLYGIKPLAGTLSNSSGAIINLSAVRALGFTSPESALGHSWIPAELPADAWRTRNEAHSRITAVVPDFAFTPVTAQIQPTVYGAWTDNQPSLAIHIRLSGADVPETLAAIDRAWSASGQPDAINRIFVADYVAQHYQDMLREAQFFSAFAAIAIVLSCLGLVGIAIATAERRTKEIGVRKAMGAGNGQIVALLLWQFAQPVLWANIIAWPLAWWLMRRWLAGFAYHVDLHWWVFAAASGAALLIALLTVAWQAFLTAKAKPVLALRYE